jgi:hypothetical protein
MVLEVCHVHLIETAFSLVKLFLTGLRGPWGCERSRFPHILDSRLRDGIEVVNLSRRPLFTSRKILYAVQDDMDIIGIRAM